MWNIRKRILKNEANQPIAVEIDYSDWCKIEEALDSLSSRKPPTDLAKHIGKVDWPVDGLQYQRDIRGEWN